MGFIHSLLFRDVVMAIWGVAGVDLGGVFHGNGWSSLTGFNWRVASWKWFSSGALAVITHFSIPVITSTVHTVVSFIW